MYDRKCFWPSTDVPGMPWLAIIFGYLFRYGLTQYTTSICRRAALLPSYSRTFGTSILQTFVERTEQFLRPSARLWLHRNHLLLAEDYSRYQKHLRIATAK